MERKHFLRAIAIAAASPAVLLAACGEASDKTAAATQTYTCPMHPQVIQNAPGTCPVCAMDLVPFDKNNTNKSLQLMDSQVALGNITTAAAGAGLLTQTRSLNARLMPDPQRTGVISSRIAGRIDKLYIRETGVQVSKGQALYAIYSENLATLQSEYLLAAAQVRKFPDDARFRQIAEGAKLKLERYGQSENDIAQLLKDGAPRPLVTYHAQQGGLVTQLSVSEGQYISEGGVILQLEDYSQLWVEADIYPAEAALIKKGQTLQVTVPGWENEPQEIQADFVYPALQTGKQTLQLRGSIRNPDARWQPGMAATVVLPVQSRSEALQLPIDAVIRDGATAHIWIEKPKNTFTPRKVRIGMETNRSVEIMEGLEEGEKVVVTGAYLLYSEYILKRGKQPV
ncbi:efflux RND transporter periplasmic adaptor subunit [Chitinophaga deserti]|uniref:efflux RND transporter periplasmic adaptor subunit n=1 Tax=Chitinophaga deserti TaxID=2164099 RepID=UPI000D6CAAF9|nr:efflux RND transporter periplasmic adaptor subunit [Chitinophaga deserti]